MKKLSIIIPAYNEEAFIGKLLEKVHQVDTESLGIEKEIIVVNDCSKDNTLKIAMSYSFAKCYSQEKNQGKGAAVKKGISLATGDYILIQDADLEYEPQDYLPMIKAIHESNAKSSKRVSVYGSRVLGQRHRDHASFQILKGKHPQQKFGPWLAGQLLSLWTFFLYGRWITDTLTAYKLYPQEVIKNFNITTCGFETDHELTAKLIKAGISIKEVPINYSPRSKEEGKKIKATDFFVALWTLFKFRFYPA